MALKKFIAHEPDRIVVIHVVAKMLVTNIFKSAVGSPADPVQKTAKPRIGLIAAENGVVAAFVNHIGGYRHRVCEQ